MVDFDVTLRVSSARLATVLEALNGSATLVSVLPCTEVTPKRARVFAYAGGKRNKGISGSELLLDTMRQAGGQRIFKTSELTEAFTAKGFNKHSASPALSQARSAGLIESVSPGHWRLTDKGREQT